MAKAEKWKVVHTRLGLKREIIRQLKASGISPKRIPEKVKKIMTGAEPTLETNSRYGLVTAILIDCARAQPIEFLPPKKTKGKQ